MGPAACGSSADARRPMAMASAGRLVDESRMAYHCIATVLPGLSSRARRNSRSASVQL